MPEARDSGSKGTDGAGKMGFSQFCVESNKYKKVGRTSVCFPKSRTRGRESWEWCGCGAAFGKDETLQCRQGLKISREEPRVWIQLIQAVRMPAEEKALSDISFLIPKICRQLPSRRGAEHKELQHG